jgi:hypothetical protein
MIFAKPIALIAFMFLALLWFSQPSHAALCGKYESFVENLKLKYQEISIAKGVAGGLIVELFVSPKGSFTILAVNPNGPTCIIAGGEGWAIGPPKTKDNET